MRPPHPIVAASLVLAANAVVAIAQRPGAFTESREHPAIAYDTAAVHTAITDLNQKLANGTTTFVFDGKSGGYLKSALEALRVPVESQALVYTGTSLQAPMIKIDNPRAVYFNDTVSVAFIRGAPLLEVSAQDPRQGEIFYTLDQEPAARPQFTRQRQCLTCHLSWDTLAVPGPMVLTTFPRRDERDYADGHAVDHRSDVRERWGGWYVTGRRVPSMHMGNLPLFVAKPPSAPAPPRQSVEGLFDRSGYLTPHSDVVALMVLEHQAHMANLITRSGWEARVAGFRGGDPSVSPSVRDAVNDLVDYMLFVDEAPFPDGRIEGSSGFADVFSARGPRDSKGRSLREMDLETRLLRYPLSYMIYTPAFAALPPAVKDAAYRRLRQVMSGQDASAKYARLTPAVRRAIVEILRDTFKDAVDGL